MSLRVTQTRKIRQRLIRRISGIVAAMLVVSLAPAIVAILKPSLTPSAAALAAKGTAGLFVPLQGALLDTRTGSTNIGGYASAMPAGQWRNVQVDGVALSGLSTTKVPADGVSAIAIDIIALSPTSEGIVRADKSGASPSSVVSYLHYYGGQGKQTNSAVLPVGSDGVVQFMTTTATDLAVELMGYYTAGQNVAAGGYVPITPFRLADTRVAGTRLPQTRIAPGATATLQVSGAVAGAASGVPSGASAAVFNFMMMNPSANGFIRPYAADQAPALDSLYYDMTDTVHGAQVGLSTDTASAGSIKIYNYTSASIDLVVDVMGYFTPTQLNGGFVPAATRVLDTRAAGKTPLASGETRPFQIAGLSGIPAIGSGISAIAMNLHVLDSGAHPSIVHAWPSGRPNVNSTALIYDDNAITSNFITIGLGNDGAVNVKNDGQDSVNIVIDVEGWYSSAGQPIISGQNRTRQFVTLQAASTGAGSWVTYKYRIGTSGNFADVPLSSINGGAGPTSWPVQKSGTTFTAYSWDALSVLPNGTSGLLQAEACYGTSSTDQNYSCGVPYNVEVSHWDPGPASEPVGPGLLSLTTGDFRLIENDVNPSDLTAGVGVSRALSTLMPTSSNSGPEGVFGPGWSTNGLFGSDGSPDIDVDSQHGYLTATYSGMQQVTYQSVTQAGTAKAQYTSATGRDDGTSISVESSLLSSARADGSVSRYCDVGGGQFRLVNETRPSDPGISYSYNAAGLVTRIQTGPLPSSPCSSSPAPSVGSKSIIVDYMQIQVGNHTETRLADLKLASQTSSGPSSSMIQAYDYDSNGFLIDAYDPRVTPSLKTVYTYFSNRLATVKRPGQAPWSLTYNTDGTLQAATRTSPAGANSTTRLVYGVSLSGPGLPNVTASEAAKWGKVDDYATTGVAIFPPDHQINTSSPASVGQADWPFAKIAYLDNNGLTVHQARFGAGRWLVDTSNYDSGGNETWSLTPSNREQAMSPTVDTDPYVRGLTNNVDRAALLSTATVHAPLSSWQVTDKFGPTHPIALQNGTVIDGRDHTGVVYDEDAPNADVDPVTLLPYGLSTTTTTDSLNVQSGKFTVFPDAAIRHSGYAPVGTMTQSGWALYEVTSDTQQMGASPSANDLVTVHVYDTDGNETESRLPSNPSGGGPQTSVTAYYSPSGPAGCSSDVMVGKICRTSPASQPTVGKELPTNHFTYNSAGALLSAVSTYNASTTSTLLNTYDASGRQTGSSVAVVPAAAGGTALPAVTYGYDSATGLQSTQSTGGQNPQILTTTYDSWASITSYTDSSGVKSTYSYDIDGRVTSFNDGKSETAFTYDSSDEHRGLVVSEDLGVQPNAATMAASYDADGNLKSETFPNGVVATYSYDNAGNTTQLVYSRNGSPWMSFGQMRSATGQIATSSYPQSSQAYLYDGAGRLVLAQDTVGGQGCTTRAYTYDADSNRVSLRTYPPASGGQCSTATTAVTTTSNYDGADRLTSTGYTYDALGRTLTVPSADAHGSGRHSGASGALGLSYYANDMIASQSQGDTVISFALDPDQNRIAQTNEGGVVTVNHFSDDSDAPSWQASGSAWTRFIAGPTGTFMGTQTSSGVVAFALVDPRGNVLGTFPDSVSPAVADFMERDEFGVARSAVGDQLSYGFLGSLQRSADVLGGTVLLGARIYAPQIGRFLSVDPVQGGNPNAYVYPLDPVGTSDPDGQHPDPFYQCFGRGINDGWVGPFFNTKKCQNWIGEDNSTFYDGLVSSGSASKYSPGPILKKVSDWLAATVCGVNGVRGAINAMRKVAGRKWGPLVVACGIYTAVKYIGRFT